MDEAESGGSSGGRSAAEHGASSASGEYHLLGPPGTGKTTALTQTWIPKAIERFGPKAVAVCSLTRAAAQELGSRQVVSLPRERIGTLHSFARRSLTDTLGAPELAQVDEALERWNDEQAKGNPSMVLSGVSSARMDESAHARSEFPRGRRTASTRTLGAPLTGDDTLNEIEVLRHRMVPRDRWPSRLLPFWSKWKAWKREEQLFDFTDLISYALENGTTPPALDDVEVRALFVDEAQDCSALEMALVRSWRDSVEVCVLSGDPNQSIYGFRGAEAHAFHDAASFPPERTYVLGQSYRLPPRVQQQAEGFLRRARSCTRLQYKARDSADQGLVSRSTLTYSPRHAQELVRVIEREVAALRDRDGDHRRVMVLASAAFMLRPVISELRSRRILYYNPFQKDRGDWNPLKTAHLHIGALFIGPRPSLTGEDGPGGRPPRLWTWGELKRWTDVVRAKGLLSHGAKANLIRESARKRGRVIMDSGDLDRVFADAASIRKDIMPMLSDESRTTEAIAWYRKQMTSAQAGRLGFALGVAQRDLKQIAEEPRVVVGTIHSVKGGTAGSVIVSPDLSRKHDEEAKATSDGFDGIVRLFYVGMTRSSSRLILCSPTKRGLRHSPHIDW